MSAVLKDECPGVPSLAPMREQDLAEVMAIATEMKNFTKTTPGSSWATDRRGA